MIHLFTKLSRFLTSTTFFVVFTLSNFGQSPQAFKYQAVIRNSSGGPVVSTFIGLRISILQDSAAGIPVFVETQTATSNDNGLVSLNIGHGTPVSGILDSVKWKNGPFFLQVEADINGGTNYQLFGSSAILGAPYALYALSGNPGPKGDPGTSSWIDGINQVTTGNRVGIGEPNPISRLDIKQDSTSTDTILFEVKDKSGQPIFAVLESGVRVYIKPGSKGSRGGFSVGGRPSSKAAADDLLWVTSDSIRMYVNTPVKKGAKGGFAVGGRSGAKGDIENFTILTPDNYSIGQGAGKSLTSGTENAFLGFRAGENTSIGSQNVFLGHYAGFSNDSGTSNVFIGDSAGFFNTYGVNNVFIGSETGEKNTTGFQNILLGIQAGYSLQGGNRNIFIGTDAGQSSTDAINNVFIGNFAGNGNTTGGFNVSVGRNAGMGNTTGNYNVHLGHRAGFTNKEGSGNVFLGDRSGYNGDSISQNVFIGEFSGFLSYNTSMNIFIGAYSGYNNTIGNSNTFIGHQSGQNSSTGSSNTFIGIYSGINNSTGNSNVFVGNYAGYANGSGYNNVYLGTGAGFFATGSNNVFIGANCAANETTSNRLYINNSTSDKTGALIYGEFDNKLLRINGTLNLVGSGTYTGSWTAASDRRLKENIVDLKSTLEKTLSLRPVSYDWKDPEQAKNQGHQIGLIAQDVEDLFPELVKTDVNGMKSMDYSRLSVILIQAFKEQEQVIVNQQSKIDKQEQIVSSLVEENKSIRQELQGLQQLKNELNKLREEVTFSSAK